MPDTLMKFFPAIRAHKSHMNANYLSACCEELICVYMAEKKLTGITSFFDFETESITEVETRLLWRSATERKQECMLESEFYLTFNRTILGV